MVIRNILICSTLLLAQAWTLQPTTNKQALFHPTTMRFGNETITTDPETLLRAAKYAIHFFEHQQKNRPIKAELLEQLIPHQEAYKTLKFVIKVLEEDKAAGRKQSRMQNLAFLKRHFSFIKWKADVKEAKSDGAITKGDEIRITHYPAFTCNGSPVRTKHQPHALYKVTSDAFMKKSTRHPSRFSFTKQQALAGALEKKGMRKYVKPLVWVSREGLEDGILQGSLRVIMPNGTHRLFNVDICNEIPYNRKNPNYRFQKRYWYFKETKSKHSVEDKLHRIFMDCNRVALSGDLKNLGFGKLLAFRYTNPKTKQNEVIFGLIIDTGGALVENLYQLELFSGIFGSKKKFKEYLREFPPTMSAYFLKKKAYQKQACQQKPPQKATPSDVTLATDPKTLVKAARYALRYDIASLSPSDKQTLRFLIRNKTHLNNPSFIKKHFSFTGSGNARLTNHALFSCKASSKKTKRHPCALYKITSRQFRNRLRKKYTKQQIVRGLLDQKQFTKHVKPLAWVSRHNLEEALLQGSILVTMPNNKKRLFNVDKSNGKPFRRAIKNCRRQKKYWFFKELGNRRRYAHRQQLDRIDLGGALALGSTKQAGSKLIALTYKNPVTQKKELRLCIRTNKPHAPRKGIAFCGSGCQLDLFAGLFNTRRELAHFTKQLPAKVSLAHVTHNCGDGGFNHLGVG